MPSDETRRILRTFGVAVTTFEDAIDKGAQAEDIEKARAELDAGLREVTALIDRLRAKKSRSS
jgi:hypothetical protein